MLWILGWLACSDNGPDIYESCESADTCEVPEDQTAECVSDGGDGFCTWACTTNADCNSPDNYEWIFVCAPFESAKGSHCFPQCGGSTDPHDDSDCPPDYECRSTGGGSENEKVCYPT